MVDNVRRIVAASETYVMNDMGIGVNSDSSRINETIDFFQKIRIVRPIADVNKSNNIIGVSSYKLDKGSSSIPSQLLEQSMDFEPPPGQLSMAVNAGFVE